MNEENESINIILLQFATELKQNSHAKNLIK